VWALHHDVLGFLGRVAAEFGDIVYFTVGPIRVVLLNHPDYIRQVLQAGHRNFVKGRPLALSKHLLGEGLLTSEGEVHARQSRVVQPAFHPERVRAYGTVMADCAARLSGRWRHGATVDLLREMTDLTMAVAGKTMFNWDVESGVAGAIGHAHEEALSLFSRVSIPFAEWLLRLPLPSTRRFYRAKAELDATIHRLIAERKCDGRDHGDLLSMLLLAEEREDGGSAMTDAQVRDQALTLFLTALDTTSLALTWTWYAIAQHPAVEADLHAELDRVLGERLPTVDDLEWLTYTRMVFLEALRLYPPTYAIARESREAFPAGPYMVPAGTLVLISPWVMHRDPRYFPDPERFDPQRWNGGGGSRPPRFAYFPFGGGPRGCIGQGYAIQEGTLVIATLGRHWRMRVASDQRVAFRPLINLRPKHGMRMILERRR
jgi:cytochrome P450